MLSDIEGLRLEIEVSEEEAVFDSFQTTVLLWFVVFVNDTYFNRPFLGSEREGEGVVVLLWEQVPDPNSPEWEIGDKEYGDRSDDWC